MGHPAFPADGQNDGGFDWKAPQSDLHLAFKVKDAGAFQLDTALGKSAYDLSAPWRSLKSAKLLLVELLGPIGSEHAVRSAGHRIFRDAFGGGEVTADEIIDTIPGR